MQNFTCNMQSILAELQNVYPNLVEDCDKSTEERKVWRLDLENDEQAEIFKEHFANSTNTGWIIYHQTTNPQRFLFSKTWICQHSRRRKVQESKRNADCKATLSIVIKKVTKATKRVDKFLKLDIPLLAEINISTKHSHETLTAESVKMLRVNSEVKETFYAYFADGMSPAQAIKSHESNFLMKGNIMDLANASLNPTKNQVYYLHKCWREENLGNPPNPLVELKEKNSFYETKELPPTNQVLDNDCEIYIPELPLIDEVLDNDCEMYMSDFQRDEIVHELRRIAALVQCCSMSKDSAKRLLNILKQIKSPEDLKRLYIKNPARKKIQVQSTSITRGKCKKLKNV